MNFVGSCTSWLCSHNETEKQLASPTDIGGSQVPATATLTTNNTTVADPGPSPGGSNSCDDVIPPQKNCYRLVMLGDLFVIVFSMDSRETFEEAIRLREQILETKVNAGAAANTGVGLTKKKIMPRVPMVLAGNKCDKEMNEKKVNVLPLRSVAGTDFNETKSSDLSDIENISLHSVPKEDKSQDHIGDDVESLPDSSQGPSTSGVELHLCPIECFVTKNGKNYTANFLRVPSMKGQPNKTFFVYPDIPDVSEFSSDQIIGRVKGRRGIPIFQVDVTKWKTVTVEEVQAYCESQNSTCVFVETSAKKNLKVDEVFYQLFLIANLPLEMAPNHHKRVHASFGAPCPLPPPQPSHHTKSGPRMNISQMNGNSRRTPNMNRMPPQQQQQPPPQLQQQPQQQIDKHTCAQHEELIRYIHDSWNKVSQELDRSNGNTAYYNEQEPHHLKNFKPFDLQAYWGRRVVQMQSQGQHL
ncbi:Small GTPase [Holotrichia oblita]|uniref:Small GTPase n=1 Tax=Holotrichia oblita TaxID=644536 RepID=A0ACB9TZA4_HOLOL|nr:Small GTPase [Holotrichia oblita]